MVCSPFENTLYIFLLVFYKHFVFDKGTLFQFEALLKQRYHRRISYGECNYSGNKHFRFLKPA